MSAVDRTESTIRDMTFRLLTLLLAILRSAFGAVSPICKGINIKDQVLRFRQDNSEIESAAWCLSDPDCIGFTSKKPYDVSMFPIGSGLDSMLVNDTMIRFCQRPGISKFSPNRQQAIAEFQQAARGKGYNVEITYALNGFPFTKFYTKGSSPHLQYYKNMEKICLENDGILPVTYSVQETMSTITALGLGGTIPMGLKVAEMNASTLQKQLIWANGLEADGMNPQEISSAIMAECGTYFPDDPSKTTKN